MEMSPTLRIEGGSLLDVGCGRGGGLSAVTRYFNIGQAVGVDLNANQISFCRRRHLDSRITFVEADSADIPFAAHTFNLVSNIESSHCYADLPAFLDEVWRLLADDGLFLLTDARDTYFGSALLSQDILKSKFALLHEEDITDRVLAASIDDLVGFEIAFGTEPSSFPRMIAERSRRLYTSNLSRYFVYILQKRRIDAS